MDEMALHNVLGENFEKDVSTTLRYLGYTVYPNESVDGSQIDLIAVPQDPLNDLVYIVECCASSDPVGIGKVKEKAGILLDGDEDRRLLYVSLNGFTMEAKLFARSKRSIKLVAFDDLESQLVDLEPYRQMFCTHFEQSLGIFAEARLAENYVALECEDLAGQRMDLSGAVHRWVTGSSSSLMFILGEYGRGKTSFCRHYVYESCKAIASRNQHQVAATPLLINLRDYRRGQSLDQVITHSLLNEYGVRIASFAHFVGFCSRGRIILIFDGFDEMKDTGKYDDVRDAFGAIYTLGALGAKCIITCRTNYFESHKKLIDVLAAFQINAVENAGDADVLKDVSFKNMATILEVTPLTEDKIKEYLIGRFGSRASKVFTQMEAINDLHDLSSRPVMLDMICETLPDLMEIEGQEINSSFLYEIYTKRWTRRDGWRSELSSDERQAFCEILAWVTHLQDCDSMDVGFIRAAVEVGYASTAGPLQLDKFMNDIQTCSFLIRTGHENQFRFAHKSFREFFVARKLVTYLLNNTPLSRDDVERFEVKKKALEAKARKEKQRIERVKIERERKRRDALEAFNKKSDVNHNTAALDSETIANNVGEPGGIGRSWPNLFGRPKVPFYDLPTDDNWGLPSSTVYTYKDDAYLEMSSALRRHFVDQTEVQLISHLREHIDHDVLMARLEAFADSPKDEALLANLRITPEVATFALELIVKDNIPIIDFLTGMLTPAERTAFVTLCGTGKVSCFVRHYWQDVLDSFLNDNAWWSSDLVPFWIREGNKVETEYIKQILDKLSADSRDRMMFAMLQSRHDYRSAFRGVAAYLPLTSSSRILVTYGVKHLYAYDPTKLLNHELVMDLLRDLSADHAGLLRDVLSIANYDSAKVERYLKEILKASKAPANFRIVVKELQKVVRNRRRLPGTSGTESRSWNDVARRGSQYTDRFSRK